MSPRRKHTGICHLCGQSGALTYEHVPPRKAFNNSRVVSLRGLEAVGLGPYEPQRGQGAIQQRGAGAFTLCSNCNNTTGSWYANHFNCWCHQAAEIMKRSMGQPTLHYFYHMFPLSILKQIMTMFCSVNGPQLTSDYPELRTFILNRESRSLPKLFRVYVYLNLTGKGRHVGLSGQVDLVSGKVTMLSELSHPPLGYLLTVGSVAPDERPVEITHFARCEYGEYACWEARLPVLPTHLTYPGDYRSREEIEEQAQAHATIDVECSPTIEQTKG